MDNTDNRNLTSKNASTELFKLCFPRARLELFAERQKQREVKKQTQSGELISPDCVC